MKKKSKKLALKVKNLTVELNGQRIIDNLNFEVKKGETFADVDLESACSYAAEDAYITLKLFHLLNEKR